VDQIELWRVFVRVVETGSFTRAATLLGQTQPTVTKAIVALERGLGSRLLYRNTRGVTLTGPGQTLYDRSRAILSEIDATKRAVRGDATELTGTLRITASIAFGRRIIAPLTIPFIRAHPQLQIDLLCEDRYADLVAQGIDVAVRLGRLADSGYGSVPLGFNPWVVVASPGYLAAAPALETPHDLTVHACLVYSSVQGDDIWRFTDSAGENMRIPINTRFRSNNLSALVDAAMAGLGITVLPSYVAASALQAGSLVPVLQSYFLPGQEMHAVFPSPQLVPPKVTLFVRHLKASLTDGWWDGLARASYSNLE